MSVILDECQNYLGGEGPILDECQNYLAGEGSGQGAVCDQSSQRIENMF